MGVKHGPVIDWWPEGEKSFEEYYNNGVPEGLWRSWWPDGKIANEKMYKNRRCIPPRMESGWSAQGGGGLEFDGTFKSAASVAQRQQILDGISGISQQPQS